MIAFIVNSTNINWSSGIMSQIISGKQQVDDKVQEWLLQTIDPQVLTFYMQ